MAGLRDEIRGWLRMWRAQLLIYRYTRAYHRAERLYPRMLQALSAVNQDHRALQQWQENRQR